MKIEIELPKGFMNVSITNDNYLVADTNDSENWDTLKFPLPNGKWKLISVDNKKVILGEKRNVSFSNQMKIIGNMMKNPDDRYGGC